MLEPLGLVEHGEMAGVTEALSTRPGFVSHISGASDSGYRVVEVWESREAHQEWVDQVISALEAHAEHYTDVPTEFILPRDPRDEPYVNLAIASGAHYLVTRDRDLLDLMEPSAPGSPEFLTRFPSVTILDPTEFLGRLEPSSEEEIAG